jgi:hypothetical protein
MTGLGARLTETFVRMNEIVDHIASEGGGDFLNFGKPYIL